MDKENKNENKNYVKELIRPKTISEKVFAFFPALFKTFLSFGIFQMSAFPPMIGTMLHSLFNKLFGSAPLLIIVPLAAVISVVFLLNLKLRLFYTYLNYFCVDRKKIPKPEFYQTTNVNYGEALAEKQRIENKLRKNWEQNFGNTIQGFTLIGSTCVAGTMVTKRIHDFGVYWRGQGELSGEFIKEMEELGYIEVGVPLSSFDHESYKFVHKDSTVDRGFEITLCKPSSHTWMYDTLIFLQYLTENKEERDKYDEFKKKHSHLNLFDYQDSKSQIIAELKEKSKEWNNLKIAKMKRDQELADDLKKQQETWNAKNPEEPKDKKGEVEKKKD